MVTRATETTGDEVVAGLMEVRPEVVFGNVIHTSPEDMYMA